MYNESKSMPQRVPGMVISTHVLDISIGKPAAAVSITLYQFSQNGKKWNILTKGESNLDGRLVFPDVSIVPSSKKGNAQDFMFRLDFEVGKYFKKHKQDTFYQNISIEFLVCIKTKKRSAQKDLSSSTKYHVPLLLSPYGYSTYRGS